MQSMTLAQAVEWRGAPSSTKLGGGGDYAVGEFNPLGRTISTSSSEIEPVLIYTNPDEHKGLIAKQNKGKSGVYRWVHKDSGKSYVGSSSMLNDRFRRYFNHSYLSSSKRGASLISKVLLKYGYAGFRLEILEYCPISTQLDREQFYIDKLNPPLLKIIASGF